jgi:hypothetical protein
MTVKGPQVATAAWLELSAVSFQRTERCLLRSVRCLEKSYQVLDRRPRLGDAAASARSLGAEIRRVNSVIGT